MTQKKNNFIYIFLSKGIQYLLLMASGNNYMKETFIWERKNTVRIGEKHTKRRRRCPLGMSTDQIKPSFIPTKAEKCRGMVTKVATQKQ